MLLDTEPWIAKFKLIIRPQRNMRGLCFLSEHIHNAHVYISWSSFIESDSSDKMQNSKNGWSQIGLSYAVDWPFYSLITENVLNK